MSAVSRLREAAKLYYAVCRGGVVYDDGNCGDDASSVGAVVSYTAPELRAVCVEAAASLYADMAREVDNVARLSMKIKAGDASPASRRSLSALLNGIFSECNDHDIAKMLEFREGIASAAGGPIPVLACVQKISSAIALGRDTGADLDDVLLPVLNNDGLAERIAEKKLGGHEMPSYIQECYIADISNERAEMEFSTAITAISNLRSSQAARPYQLYAARLYLGKVRSRFGLGYFHPFSRIFGGYSKNEKREAVSEALVVAESGGIISEKSRKVLSQGRTQKIFNGVFPS